MKDLLLRVIVHGVSGALIGALLIGLFALFVAGEAGLANGLGIGAVGGFLGGMSIGATVDHAFWWEGVVKRWAGRREK